MIGRLNLRGLETTQTHRRAWRPRTRRAPSRVDAGPSSTATRRRGAPCEPGRRRNGPPRAPASGRGHPLRPGESWSRSVVPYTHHTANDASSQMFVTAVTGCTAINAVRRQMHRGRGAVEKKRLDAMPWHRGGVLRYPTADTRCWQQDRSGMSKRLRLSICAPHSSHVLEHRSSLCCLCRPEDYRPSRNCQGPARPRAPSRP